MSPTSPRRACLTPGCRSTVPSTTKGGRCELHTKTNTREYSKYYNENVRMAHDPRSSARWKKLRAMYSRAHPVCERCHDAFATQVHHRGGGGTDPDLCYDTERLVALCDRCHHQVEAEERKRA
jgi:hypothetical protein